MADTRVYNIALSPDGNYLYANAESAGGNTIFRWNGKDLSTRTLVSSGSGSSDDLWMARGANHINYIGKINTNDGTVERGTINASISSKGLNTTRARDGDIIATNDNVYTAGYSAAHIPDRDAWSIDGIRVNQGSRNGYAGPDGYIMSLPASLDNREFWLVPSKWRSQSEFRTLSENNGKVLLGGFTNGGEAITSSNAIQPFNAEGNAKSNANTDAYFMYIDTENYRKPATENGQNNPYSDVDGNTDIDENENNISDPDLPDENQVPNVADNDPRVVCGLNSFREKIFDGRNQSTLLREKCVDEINYNWNNSGPENQKDTFSANFEGVFEFEPGLYEFNIKSDDGVRIKLNGQTLLDEYRNQRASFARRSNLAGEVRIEVDYFENFGGAMIEFDWVIVADEVTEITCAENAFIGFYANSRDVLDEGFDLIRCDESIDFNWGSVSTAPEINIESFNAVWQTTRDLDYGTDQFTTTSDDGVRLYINDNLVIDEWKDNAPKTYNTDPINLSGDTEIRMEYYENRGGAVAELSWNKLLSDQDIANPCPDNQFKASYYNDRNFASRPVRVECLDQNSFKYDWKDGAPDKLNRNNFSIVWEGNFDFDDGNYKFNTVADDGVRVFVDGNQVIDGWKNQAPTKYSTDSINLNGKKNIRMEYYENRGGAVAEFNWVKLGNSKINCNT